MPVGLIERNHRRAHRPAKVRYAFVVVYAAPGCLPDDPDDNICFGSLRDAQRYVREEIADGRGGEDDYYQFDILQTTMAEAEAEGYDIQ